MLAIIYLMERLLENNTNIDSAKLYFEPKNTRILIFLSLRMLDLRSNFILVNNKKKNLQGSNVFA